MTLQPRSRLREQDRRADELTVLNDLARRLAALRDPAEVLQEVVVQARRLLRMDVAYIMRLKGEVGLRTGRPLWSEVYLSDERFPHVSAVDQAAASERLGGVLGVPLVVGGETIGVLLCADRRPRRFAGREIELLAALAAHAAVAIRNADLFEQHRAAARQLHRANAELQATDDARQRAVDLRESLTEVVVRGGGFEEVAAEVGRVVGVAVTVLGAHDDVLAGAAPREPPVDRTAFDGSTAPVRSTGADGHRVALPVHLSSGYAGCLVGLSPVPAGEEAVRLLTVGATSVALVVASERSVAEVERRTRGELVTALLSADPDEVSLRRRARSAGVDVEWISVVAVLDPGGQDPRAAAELAARLVTELGGWSADHGDRVVALVAGPSPAEVAERLVRLAFGPLPCAVGIAPCTGGSRAVRDSHKVARQTATVLHALGRSRECAQAGELGVYRSLFSQAGRGELTSFVQLTIGPLLDHDRARRRALSQTLSTYLRLSQHHARTCAELHIHANTLYQRLERVTELIGPRWREPDRGLEVQLALRLHELLEKLHDTAEHP